MHRSDICLFFFFFLSLGENECQQELDSAFVNLKGDAIKLTFSCVLSVLILAYKKIHKLVKGIN